MIQNELSECFLNDEKSIVSDLEKLLLNSFYPNKSMVTKSAQERKFFI